MFRLCGPQHIILTIANMCVFHIKQDRQAEKVGAGWFRGHRERGVVVMCQGVCVVCDTLEDSSQPG